LRTTKGLPVIVLVEDDDGLRGALDRMLAVSGFQAMSFGTAEGARDRAPWENVACVVADIRLPGMSGFDLVAWLRDSWPQTSVIVITAAPSPRTREIAASLGVSACLEKPVRRHALVGAIRDALAA